MCWHWRFCVWCGCREAGADLLLMPENFAEAYTGVLEAIVSGGLTEERIDESLARILKVKLKLE